MGYDRTRTTAKAGPFSTARQGPRSLLVIEHDRTRAVDLPEEGTLVIGRAPEVEIVVSDPSVSRRQVQLSMSKDEILAHDLGSSNGTFLGSELLTGIAPLRPGVALRVGSAVILLADSGVADVWGLLSQMEFEARLGGRIEAARAKGKSVAVFMVRAPGTPGAVVEALRKTLGADSSIGQYSAHHYQVAVGADSSWPASNFARTLERGLSASGVTAEVGCALFPRDGTSEGELLAVCTKALRPPTAEPGEGPVVVEPAMQTVFDLARKVAAGRIPVLIVGETGSGKEVVAEHIHRSSPRADKPLSRLNCAAFPESLLEAELFGFEKGTFTGAAQAKPGLFEAADGATLLLDEVGELPLGQQAKLLRALEDGTVRRLGSLTDRRVDVRLLAATNRDLEAASAQGTFRKDLYFRLSGAIVSLPPLRERPADILGLARRFLAEMGGGRVTLGPAAEEAIGRYSWPGNVRELRNAIERAVLLFSDGVLQPEHLPDRVRLATGARASSVPPVAEPGTPPVAASTVAPPSPSSRPKDYTAVRDEMRELERSRILEVLEACGGNQTSAAKKLGISRRTLVAKIAALGIPRRKA
ncbi:MAG: sigma 54-interacting transcriptional regulator [Deltaproteobacteria bacterium]|nr:sigma 54-interacting transcriptional regulator [Deltaproteobacteria bacterium]